MCKAREVGKDGIASAKAEKKDQGNECRTCKAHEAEIIFLHSLVCVIIGFVCWNNMWQ